MSMWSNIDDGLYCMFMNKVEIMDAVVNELIRNADEYDGSCFEDMVEEACANLGYNFNDLSDYDINEIYRRVK